jgi:hypothetical protein
MRCPVCQHQNPHGQKFSGECGVRLAAACASCGASNPPGQKFCGECGVGLAPEMAGKSASPIPYTPKHLAERRRRRRVLHGPYSRRWDGLTRCSALPRLLRVRGGRRSMIPRTIAVVLLVAAAVAAGCATKPIAPSVMVLPGTSKPIDQFWSDEATCRQEAAAKQPASQWEYDTAFMQCMYGKGHQIPVRGGYTSGSAGIVPPGVPPPPAGTPPPPPPAPTR